MVSIPLTEGNNRNFSSGSPLNSFLVKVVSFPLTEGKKRNFARGSPTEIPSFWFLWSTGLGWHYTSWVVDRFSLPCFVLKRVIAKPNYNDKNCGIFKNFIVGIFCIHPGQCGTPPRPNWDMIRILWLILKINTLDVSQIELKINNWVSSNWNHN